MRAILCLFAFSAAMPALATTAQRATLSDLVKESQKVVLGTVGTHSSFWQRGRILTRVEILVEESWSGDSRPGTSLEVVTLGGRVGDIGQNVSGAPRLERGERVVLCLQTKGEAYRVVEMSQGVFFSPQPDGDSRVVQRLNGMRLVGPEVVMPKTLFALKRRVLEIIDAR